jgi:hypothetical protein
MNNKKTIKFILILTCLLFIFMFFSNTIIVFNFEHLHSCHEQYCQKCHTIHTAEKILKGLSLQFIAIFIFPLIIQYFIRLLNYNNFISDTLVNFKVQFNE